MTAAATAAAERSSRARNEAEMSVRESELSGCWAVTDDKFDSLLDIIVGRYRQKFENALVVGCGTGREAILLNRRLDCSVEGIDITDYHFEKQQNSRVRLRVMDICESDYETGRFDFLYSFHVLEHIPDLDTALKEMRRLLKPGGVFCIGTPNKSRLIGSIGTREPLKVKILYNLNDWKMRLTNRWDNSLGAHAGFTRSALREISASTFGESIDITDEYYRRVYRSWSRTIENIIKFQLGNFVFPGVYMLGSRREG
jgi:SAM-dependent methyltransferase